jgi:hypothetical protein
MLRRNRIPEKNTAFNDYIYNTTAALLRGTPPTWQRLGIQESDKDKWIDFMNQWDEVYPKHSSDLTRTKVTTINKNKIRKDFTKFATRLLNWMTANNPTESDRATFHLCAKNRPYRKRGQIEEAPLVMVKSLGDGLIKISVRTENHQSRSGMHPWADALEVVYHFGHRVAAVPLEQCTHVHRSKQSYFILTMPNEARDQWAYFYFRWANYRKPENSGPYGQMYMAVVG